MTTEEVERVAAGLTKAQREAIRAATDQYGVFGTKPFRNRLAALGICSFDSMAGRGSSWLCPFGLAVRGRLQETRRDR